MTNLEQGKLAIEKRGLYSLGIGPGLVQNLSQVINLAFLKRSLRPHYIFKPVLRHNIVVFKVDRIIAVRVGTPGLKAQMMRAA